MSFLGYATLVALVAASCSAEPGGITTIEEQVTPPPSVTEEQTTTTIVEEPVDISGRGIVWEVGRGYLAPGFITPLSFWPTDPGWRSLGAEEDWVFATWVAPSQTDVTASLVALAYQPSAERDAVTDAITSIEGVDPISQPRETSVANRPATVMDVEGAPLSRQGRQCSPSTGRFFDEDPAHRLVPPFGIPACNFARIWVVDVEGTTITFVGAAEDPERFEEVIPTVERLMESLSFGT